LIQYHQEKIDLIKRTTDQVQIESESNNHD